MFSPLKLVLQQQRCHHKSLKEDSDNSNSCDLRSKNMDTSQFCESLKQRKEKGAMKLLDHKMI